MYLGIKDSKLTLRLFRWYIGVAIKVIGVDTDILITINRSFCLSYYQYRGLPASPYLVGSHHLDCKLSQSVISLFPYSGVQ